MARKAARRIKRPPGVEYEDAVQEAYLIALRRYRQWEADPLVTKGFALPAWLWFRIVSGMREQYRKVWRQVNRGIFPVSLFDQEGKLRFDRLQPAHLDESSRVVVRDLLDSTLTRKQARAMRMVFLEGMTQIQVGTALGISQSAVSHLIRRAIRTLGDHES